MKQYFKIQGITKTAMILAAAFELLLVGGIVFSIVNTMQMWPRYSSEPHTLPLIISSVVGMAGSVALLFLVFRLMQGIRSSYSPFSLANARRLKIMALLLGFMGVLQLGSELFASLTWYPSGNGTYIRVVRFTNTTPLMLVLAFVVYCVAIAFRHGAELQQQSDETL